jgi:hypothetical protein
MPAMFSQATRGLVAVVLSLEACTSSAPSSTPNGGSSDPPILGTGAVPGFPRDASLPEQVGFVFGGCAGGPETSCHAAGIAAAGLTLPDTTPSNLVNVPSSEQPTLLRVMPGDPARSYLFLKVTGAPGIDGGRMPKDDSPLDTESIDAVERWIEAGAPP